MPVYLLLRSHFISFKRGRIDKFDASYVLRMNEELCLNIGRNQSEDFRAAGQINSFSNMSCAVLNVLKCLQNLFYYL